MFQEHFFECSSGEVYEHHLKLFIENKVRVTHLTSVVE